MDARIALYYVVAVAGFVMVVGGMWLIAKQKIYIDRESKQPVEIKLPLGVSVKSNYPALALFALLASTVLAAVPRAFRAGVLPVGLSTPADQHTH